VRVEVKGSTGEADQVPSNERTIDGRTQHVYGDRMIFTHDLLEKRPFGRRILSLTL
jgi:hypothetical protein